MNFLAFFAVLWSGFVLTFDVLSVRGICRQFASKDYAVVTGTVTHSEVFITHSSKGGTKYKPRIYYNYAVNGHDFSNERLRYTIDFVSDAVTAQALVNAHPVGSAVQVYFNRGNPEDSLLLPGIAGSDLTLVLALTPFNAVMLVFWIWLTGMARERLVHPVAGGVKIIKTAMTTRIRLPKYPAAVWGLATLGVLGAALSFIVTLGSQARPSVANICAAIGVTYLGVLAVYVWNRLRMNTGIFDLVIDPSAGTIALPRNSGRKERVTVNIKDIEDLSVEVLERRGSRGGTTYTYAPTLHLRSNKFKLAEWMDKLKADDFTTWLRQQLGL